jgi:fatty-acyl-CoA synthase
MAESGEVVTYRELEERSNRLAQAFAAAGLAHGDVVALVMENGPRYHEVAWAVLRSGMYLLPVNTHLQPEEVAYVVADSGARLVIVSPRMRGVAAGLRQAAPPAVQRWWSMGGDVGGYEPIDAMLAAMPAEPIPDETEGDVLQYSSGTTGRPKGIRRPLTGAPMGEGGGAVLNFLAAFGLEEGDTYLSPAPLYHSAPIFWTMGVHRLGGTVVVMERFDAEHMLAAIERYAVTHMQLVPTMFVRLLKLREDLRAGYDLSSLRAVIHAAAPCPVDVKRRMIAWWGPIISEYYSSSEGAGGTFITAQEWLEHPGSVGRPILGVPHIVGEDGTELPSGEAGQVWFEGAVEFDYLGDPAKTAETTSSQGWRTVGDVGWLDEDGYLHLTDRRAFTIIRGGVNIYPREIEDVLLEHPRVLDVAVFGVPDEEFGERVHAVVQPDTWPPEAGQLAEELRGLCLSKLAPFKCPAAFDFEQQLPRTDAGKLYKRLLRERYLEETGSPA